MVKRGKVHVLHRERMRKYKLAQKERGFKQVILWLPEDKIPVARRWADACRRVAGHTSRRAQILYGEGENE